MKNLTVGILLEQNLYFTLCESLGATMILLDKVATKVHLTYDDGGENHKERVYWAPSAKNAIRQHLYPLSSLFTLLSTQRT